MLQVGVDVTRLGLMLLVGQPKNTAEYIQASSRVGRNPQKPGLVVTLGNWARPRDLAHYEQFRHYHETFYAQVEPLSVTPFSVTSMERGLDGVLVSAARVLQAATANGLSPEKSAGRVAAERPFLEQLIEALVARVRRASDEHLPTALGYGYSTGWTSGTSAAPRSSTNNSHSHTNASRTPASLALSSAAPKRRGHAATRTTGHPSSSPTRCAKCSPRSTCWSARSRRTCTTSRLSPHRPGRPK